MKITKKMPLSKKFKNKFRKCNLKQRNSNKKNSLLLKKNKIDNKK